MLVMMSPTIEMVPSPRLFAVNMVNSRLMFPRIEIVHLNLLQLYVVCKRKSILAIILCDMDAFYNLSPIGCNTVSLKLYLSYATVSFKEK